MLVAWAAAAVAGDGWSAVSCRHTLLPGLGQLSLPRGCIDGIFLPAAVPYHSPLACLHSQCGTHLRLPFQEFIDILILLLASVNGGIRRLLQRGPGKNQVLFLSAWIHRHVIFWIRFSKAVLCFVFFSFCLSFYLFFFLLFFLPPARPWTR